METINDIELRDEAIYPDDHVLKRILGASYTAYAALLELFGTHGLGGDWRYYTDGKAWLCKVQKKAKTIIWMSAWKDYMQATIYLPERLLPGLYALEISEDVKKKIENTKNVGASKPCIFEIRNKDILKDLETVMDFKIRSK